MTTYGFLGVGSIADAMVTGLCEGVADPPDIVLSPRSADRVRGLSQRYSSVRVAESNQLVTDAAEVIVLSMLPEQAQAALETLRFRRDHSVISAMAGVDLEHLRALVTPATDIARSIPVPAAAQRASLTPVCPATSAAVDLFSLLGEALQVRTEMTLAFMSAASATVAAHFAYLDTITSWLNDHGVEQMEARRFVGATFAALSEELQGSVAFRALASAHTTPGGLNEQFAGSLEGAGSIRQIRSGLDDLVTRLTTRTEAPRGGEDETNR